MPDKAKKEQPLVSINILVGVEELPQGLGRRQLAERILRWASVSEVGDAGFNHTAIGSSGMPGNSRTIFQC